MQAYRNDPTVKERLLIQLRADYAKGRIRQGRYWVVEEECGCLVGCATREPSNNGNETHAAYEWMYHIPRQLSRLFDGTFESLSLAEARQFTLAIHEAIPVGADLSLVVPQFICWVLDRAIKACPESGAKQIAVTVRAMEERVLHGETISQGNWYQTGREAYRLISSSDDEEYVVASTAWEACMADEERFAKRTAEAAIYMLSADQAIHYWREVRDQILFLVKGAPHGSTTGTSSESVE